MTSRIDHAAMFRQVTGRSLTPADADELRRLLALLPAGLADSPSYIADLMVRYHQWGQLRDTISGASEAIVDDVQHQSKAAVTRLVDDAVKRIYATSPSSEDALLRAAFALFTLTLVCSFVAGLAIFGAISMGWISPSWLSEESTYKVQWADAVEERIGRGSVDWIMREGKPDQSLVEILQYVEKRRTPNDPIRQLAELRRCEAPGQVAYRSRGKSMCRFQVVDK